jgi:hypothetical protein
MKRLVLLSFSRGDMCKRDFRHKFAFSSEKQFQQELGNFGLSCRYYFAKVKV